MKKTSIMLMIVVTAAIAISGCDFLSAMFPGEWEVLGDTSALGSNASFIDMGIDEVTGTIYVAYQDGAGNSVSVIKYEEFGSQTWQYVGNRHITGSLNEADYISIFIDDGTPIISFNDSNVSSPSVMEFNGSSWEYVGGSAGGIFLGPVTNTSVWADAGTVYLAYRDSLDNSLEVSIYNGVSWAPYAGNTGVFSKSGTADYIDIERVGSTTLVSYTDFTTGDISVISSTGSGWSVVGKYDIYGAEAKYGNIVYGDGTLYVALAEKNGSAAVLSYENSQWAPVDQPTISAGTALYMAADYYQGDIIVAYKDGDNGSRITGQIYDGTEWSFLGDPGFTPGKVNWIALAAGNAGYYAAFSDVSDGNKVTVYVYH